jgi:hypothetical protein
MGRFTRIILCIAIVVSSPIMKVAAGEQSVRIQGLVVSSIHGLVLNDGTRDYLLLGVDDIGIQGRICVITGILVRWMDRDAIDVREALPVADEERPEDTIGMNRLRRAPQSAGTSAPFGRTACVAPFTPSTAQAA